MRGLIDLAIAETNTAFFLSGVTTTQLRLVHAYREPTYVEQEEGDEDKASDSSSSIVGSALSSLRNKEDGALDDVHAMRDAYGADIVDMIIDDPKHCGMSYLGPRSDLMFSVTSWNCATGFYSFGNAVGRNMVGLLEFFAN